MPKDKFIEILEELKQLDYECFCHKGFSRLIEEQCYLVINNVKEELNKM